MKLARWLTPALAAVSICGVVYAMQQGRNGPGEVEATCSLTLNEEEEEIALTYHTLKYGAATLGRIRSDPKMAEGWAGHIPEIAATQFDTDVDLMLGGKEVAAGQYKISFLAKGEGAWDLQLIDSSKTTHSFPLEVMASPLTYEHLSFQLLSNGQNKFRVVFAYGPEIAVAEGEVAMKE
jgi:hypothetical protein